MSKSYPVDKCADPRGCPRPPRAAIRTTRPTRGDLRVTLYSDNRTAPKTALRYCHEHAVALMTELTRITVDGDDCDDLEASA